MNGRAWASWSFWLLSAALINRLWGVALPMGVPAHSKSRGIVLLGESPPIAPSDREWNSVHRLAMGRTISISHASAPQLEALPNIGPKRAAEIVRYRNENGNFASIGALMNVHGIGPRTVQRVAPFVEP